MSRSRSFRILTQAGACASLAVGSLAGCAGGVASTPSGTASTLASSRTTSAATAPVQAPRMDTSACGKSLVYVTSFSNSVYIYDQFDNGKMPCGEITGVTNPQYLFVDAQRNLWVAISGDCRTAFSSVLEFAPGNPTPIKTLQDPAGTATDVAVDNKSGTVYVTNFFNYTNGCASGNPGVVEVYANGSTTPTATLSDPNMNYAGNDAVDDQGNLYVTYLHLNGPTGNGQIDEWIGGTGSPVNLGITLGAPGGIQTTSTGALLVCDQTVGCGDFAPGSTTMTNLFATKHPGASAVALDKHEKHAYVENEGLFKGQLQRYVYPGPDAHAVQMITVPGGGYAGVAVSPAAPQGLPY